MPCFSSIASRTLPALLLAAAGPAHAQLPQPVRDMLEAAIATGEAQKVATVAEIARATNPDDTAEIDTLEQAFETEQRQLAAQETAAKREAIQEAGFFENWSGEGEIGAARSSGNSSNTGLTAGLKLAREGIDWEHRIRARADYQRSNGVTTKEQYLAAYQPRYNLSPVFFAYGLAQYERDRFQGFSARYSGSVGAGYRVIDDDTVALTVEAGPAYRRTEFVDGTSDGSISAFAGLDAGWQIAERIALTQEVDAFLDSGNVTLTSLTGLEAGLGVGLRARLSYGVEYDSDPPAGAVSTDTLSRFTLIYGF